LVANLGGQENLLKALIRGGTNIRHHQIGFEVPTVFAWRLDAVEKEWDLACWELNIKRLYALKA
jgi:hypothetical protein